MGLHEKFEEASISSSHAAYRLGPKDSYGLYIGRAEENSPLWTALRCSGAWEIPEPTIASCNRSPFSKWGIHPRDVNYMWVEFKRVPNLMVAEMWREALEAEGLPTRILPEGDIRDWAERIPFRVYVPKGREHVAEEILRKL